MNYYRSEWIFGWRLYIRSCRSTYIDMYDFVVGKFKPSRKRSSLPKSQVSMRVSYHNRQLPLKGRCRGDVGLM